MIDQRKADALAGQLYTAYCQEVGGKAYDGKPLPTWVEFSKDPIKRQQVNGWRAVAVAAIKQTATGVSFEC